MNVRTSSTRMFNHFSLPPSIFARRFFHPGCFSISLKICIHSLWSASDLCKEGVVNICRLWGWQKTYIGAVFSSSSSSDGSKSSPTRKMDPNEMNGFSDQPIHFSKLWNGLTFSALVVLAFLETHAAWALQMRWMKGTHFVVFCLFHWTSVAEPCCRLFLNAGSRCSWGVPSLLCLCSGIEGEAWRMIG